MKQEIILKIEDLNKEQIEQILKIINDSGKQHRYKPQTKEELKNLVIDERIYLGDIDTSLITDMSCLFFRSKRTDFNGIENWDVSNVENMSDMFYEARQATPDVSKWNVSNVKDMRYMFANTETANPDVSMWDVSKVENISGMFSGAINANPDVSKWDVSNVTDMSWMFYGATQANPDVSQWNVSNVWTMSCMFRGAKVANPDISSWNISKIKYATEAFVNSSFDYNTLKTTNFDLNKFF